MATLKGGSYVGGDFSVASNLYAGGNIYGAKVYGAVYNDLVDFIELDSYVEVECGKVYYRNTYGSIQKTNKYGQHALGIASDTFGFSMGQKEGVHQIPIALGGWVLAYVDKKYIPGTPLVATKNGYLTKASFFTKSYDIVAFFDRAEHNEMWYGVEVKGRYWVKVVG